MSSILCYKMLRRLFQLKPNKERFNFAVFQFNLNFIITSTVCDIHPFYGISEVFIKFFTKVQYTVVYKI